MSTKTATKKAPKLPPITLKGATRGTIGYTALQDAFHTLPTSVLKERLRERGLPIPKDKDTMAARLADWAIRQAGTFNLTLA